MSNTKQQIEGIVRDYDTWCLCDCDECPGSYGYKRAVEAIDRLVTEACLQEFKTMWNKTQPDIVPEGWTPDTEEGEYIKDRIAELKSQLNDKEGE